jgi:peptidoglycan/LPS O-acetylase OafA/YrhL
MRRFRVIMTHGSGSHRADSRGPDARVGGRDVASSPVASSPDAYRPDIDGLRAIAVLAAVLFHAGLFCPGGYVGVDVFFVISGYLITRQVADDLDGGRFSLARFWERRVRRIWPASLVMTAAVLAAGWLLLLPLDLRLLANDATAHLAMLANVRYRVRTDYFAAATELRPLLHTWSLAVEEQFYLLLPLLLAAAWRLGRHACVGIAAALAVASLVVAQLQITTDPKAAFYLLPARGFELLCGSLLALVRPPPFPAGAAREAAGVAGLVAIIAPCLLYDRQTPFPAAAALPPCLGTVLLLAANEPPGLTAVGRLLSAPPLVAVGLASYSLYLWHWPVLAFLRVYLGPAIPLGWLAAAAVLVAIVTSLSWRFVERPCRRVPAGSSPLRTILAAAAIAAAMAGVCLLVRRADGVPRRFAPAVLTMLEPYCTDWEFAGRRAADDAAFPPIGAEASSGGECFLLWGDSHGMAVSPAIDAAARELGVPGAAALQVAAAPLPGVWQPWGQHALAGRQPSQAWVDRIALWMQRHRPRHLILCARWSMYVTDDDPEKRGTHLLASLDADQPSTTAARLALAAGLGRLLSLCAETDTDLWVLLEPPHQPHTPQARALAAHWSGRPPALDGVTREEHERAQRPVAEAIASRADDRLHVVDLAAPFFGADGVSRVGREGAGWYSDATHVSPAGAREALGPLLRDVFTRIAADCGPRKKGND